MLLLQVTSEPQTVFALVIVWLVDVLESPHVRAEGVGCADPWLPETLGWPHLHELTLTADIGELLGMVDHTFYNSVVVVVVVVERS